MKPWMSTCLATGVIFAVSLLMSRPLWENPAGRLINDYDGAMISWTLAKVTDALARFDLENFWDGDIFYPHQTTLAFSDPYIGLGLFLIPTWLLTHEPIALQTLAVLLSISLTGLMMYFWLEELSGKRVLSLVATLIFITSPLYVVFLGHVHTACIPGVVLGLLALTKLAKNQPITWWYVWCLAFWWQTATAPMTGAFMGLLLVGWILLDQPFRNQLKTHSQQFIGSILVLGTALLPLLLPFYEVSQTYDYRRSIREAAHFSMSLDQLATDFASPLLFGVIGAGWWVFNRHQKKGSDEKRLWLLGLGFFILSLGPVLKWQGETAKIPFPIPLPYSVFYYVVPPLQGFRAVVRFILPASVLLLGAAVRGLKTVSKKGERAILVWGVAGMLVWFPQIGTVSVPTIDQYPEYVYWLKNQPRGVVIELPLFRWGSDAFSKNETRRMLFQTVHGKTLVNGYSGFSPPDWEAMVERVQGMEVDDGLLAYLRDYGVEYAVVHTDEYERWKGFGVSLPQGNRVFTRANVTIYDLRSF